MIKRRLAFSVLELVIAITITSLLLIFISKSKSLIDKANKVAQNIQGSNSEEGQPFSVADISNLDVWYEATSSQSFSAGEMINGSAITSWYDQNPNSVNKNHLRQDGLAAVPKYKTNCIGNLSCVNFDGVSRLKGDYPVNISNSEPGTVIVVGYTAYNNYNSTPLSITNGNDSKAFRLDINTTSNQSGARYDGGNVLFQSPFNSSGPFIAIFSFSNVQDSSTVNLYVNGANVTRASYNNSSIRPIENNLFLIGCNYNRNYGGYINFFRGDLSEIIIYNKEISDIERQQIESYLSEKYNIAIN